MVPGGHASTTNKERDTVAERPALLVTLNVTVCIPGLEVSMAQGLMPMMAKVRGTWAEPGMVHHQWLGIRDGQALHVHVLCAHAWGWSMYISTCNMRQLYTGTIL